MIRIKKKAKANRPKQQVDDEESLVITNWLELCPDLLRCIFKRLSFTSLNRSKSVCSLWHTASIDCVPYQNQIPWLILFPCKNNNTSTSTSCVFFIPEDRERVYYTSRDLGVDFVESHCLMTCGSWLLMHNNHLLRDLYILNPLTGERIDLPETNHLKASFSNKPNCFWIDNKTKDYLVVMPSVFTKKGSNKWLEFPIYNRYGRIVYSHKIQKLYIFEGNNRLKILDFSGDKPIKEGFLDCFWFNHYDFPSWIDEDGEELYWKMLLEHEARLAVTVSGDVLLVSCIVLRSKTWHFRIYKTNHMKRRLVKVKSLGDEALIYDMGLTVVAKDIPGIKRNSIYFSGLGRGVRDDPDYIFVFDLTTNKMEPLPQCVFSSISFSDARWFFP